MKNSLLLRWSSAIALLLGSMGAVAQPTFEALFSPETIGPGADSELIFTITNAAGPVRDLAFTATLPAGLALADPVLLDTNCELAEILAPAGGSTVELLTGRLGGGSSCEVRVVVRPSTVGMFTLVTGDLNSSAGNSGNATDDLTVTASRPGFSKTYSPTSVPLLGRSTVTYIWDNSLIGGNTFNLSFNDRLPKGLVVAEPPNATIDCIASFTPVAGASVVGAFSGFLRGGETCTMTVDVIAEGAGRLASRTLDASSSTGGTIGFSANVLDVTISRPALTLQINDDPAPFADVATLEFEIINGDRSRTLTNGAFSLDLDAALSGLATALLPTNPCGAGSSLTGGSAINLSGATVPPGGRCSFEVQVSIPAAGPSGNFDLVTAPITGDLGGSMEMGNAAAEVLQVSTAPIFEKRILGGPYTPADTVTIEYTLTNPDPDNSATSISFFDRLTNDNTDFALAPANNLCNGSGNVISRDTPFPGSNFNRPAIFFGGGTLAAGASCTFTVDVTLGDVIPAGSHPGTSLPIMATVNGVAQTGQEATAVLDIITVPRIALELQQVVVAPGDTVTADVTIAYDTSAGEAATGPDALALAASIDLDAVLPGLVAIGITPGMDPCGAGSATMGTMAVDLTGGTLSIGSSCTFSIDLQVPADATPGTYLIRTSTVTGTISGSPIEAAASSAELSVSGLSARMRFVESPISASASRVMLEYTIENTSPTQTASSIQFSHDLDTLPSGLFSFSPTQNDVCGAGSSVSGTTFIIFAGGTLGPGETCSFSLDLNLPAGQVGSYTSQTGSLFGLIDGNFAVLGSAVATLDINAGLQMTKAFSPESIPVGGMGTLSFTVTNLAGTAATGVTFTDDLDAALSGLVAVATPQSDICGAGSSLTGSGSLSLTGGSLAPGETCEFSTLVMVPAGAIAGASALNTVSDLSGTIDGIGVAPAGIDAEASFSVDAITLDAQLVGIPAPGQNVVLNFDIANANVASPQRDVAFSVDLATIADAALTWPGPELTGFCGANSQAVVDLTGTVLTVRGLDLVAPTTMCSFGVTLAVGAMPVRAVYTLDTSSVLGRAGVLGGGASVVIDIPQEVGFAKAFGPTPILEDGVSTLTFMIDNTANTIAASSLDFTDNLPAGLVVAAPSNTTTTCTGGTLTAVPGSGAIAYSGGSVAAGATCALSVDVTASAQGTYVNVSGNLTSNLGTSGTASATLEVYALPVITKEYDVPSAQLGSIARLRYIIDSTAVDVDATMINFTDMLPATIVIATPANTAGTCGGTFNAAAGGSQTELINGSVTAGTSCTLEADVEIVAVGDNSSTTSAISLVLGGDLPATIDGATGGFVGIAPPELEADSYEVPEGDLLGAGAATGLLANDDDPDDDDLSVVAVDGADVVGSAYEPPAGGELTVATDGTFSFDTRADFEALDDGETAEVSFTYTVSDGTFEVDGMATITVTGRTDTLDAQDDAFTISEDGALDGNVLEDNGGGPDSGGEADEVLTVTTDGTFDADGIGGAVELFADGSFSYTPPANAFGTASFTYTVADDTTLTDTATVTIEVVSVNDPPSFIIGPDQTLAKGAELVQSVLGWATAIDAGPNEGDQEVRFQVSVVEDPNVILDGEVRVTQTGELRYSLTGTGGTAVVSINARDNGGRDGGGENRSDAVTFEITYLETVPAQVILRRSDTQKWTLYLLDGYTRLSNGARPYSPNPAWTTRGVRDLNGDGVEDLLIRNDSTGEWHVYFLNGATGLINSRRHIGVSRDLADEFQGLGDLNGDGIGDVLTRNGDSWNVWYLTASGLIAFTQELAIDVPATTATQGIGDFDGDGTDELLVRDTATGEWTSYTFAAGTGEVTGTRIPAMTTSSQWTFQGVGDFDGNGRDDALLRRSNGRWLIYNFDAGGNVTSDPRVSMTPNQTWEVRWLDDFDGDGNTDVLLRRTNTLQWTLYRLDGATVLEQGKAPLTPKAVWVTQDQ